MRGLGLPGAPPARFSGRQRLPRAGWLAQSKVDIVMRFDNVLPWP